MPDEPPALSPGPLSVTSAYDRDGNINRLSAPFEPAAADIVLMRVAASKVRKLGPLRFYDFCTAKSALDAVFAAQKTMNALDPAKRGFLKKTLKSVTISISMIGQQVRGRSKRKLK